MTSKDPSRFKEKKTQTKEEMDYRSSLEEYFASHYRDKC